MPLRKLKIDRVLIKETKPNRFQICWLDRDAYKYVRRMLPAETFAEAKRVAKTLNLQLASQNGSLGGNGVKPHRHTVRKAVLEAIQASDARPQTKRTDYIYRYNTFSAFLTERSPKISLWSQVTPKVLAEFLAHCREQRCAHDTIRLRFAVIRLTSSYMSRNYDFKHVTDHFKIRRTEPARRDRLGDSILSPEQLRSLLKWLKANEPMIYLWAAMQGLCGLRGFEAIYLREQDFDAASKTITITDTGAHRPKNASSYRTIPVCDAVAVALSGWIAQMKVRNPSGILFSPTRVTYWAKRSKEPAVQLGAFSANYASRLFTEAIERARADGVDIPEAFIPRKCRATFITAMRSARADYADLQAYVGQSVRTVLSQHYDHVSTSRLKEIADLAQELHDGSLSFERKTDVGGR